MKKFILGILLFFIPFLGFGQPSNNTCENAIDISSNIGGNVCGDDTDATNDTDDGDETSCYDSDSEVWYSFTGVTSIELQITSWCGSTYEPNITVYEGSCGGGLTEIACDDYGGAAEVVQAGSLDSNSTYYISVDNDDFDCEGNFCFDINEASEGDCLGSASNIDECGTNFTLNTADMGQCGGQCCGSTVNSNYDNACGSSTCGTCADGCDMNGSTENNAFWGFVPTESCDYEVTMDIYNCDNEGSCYSCTMGIDTCCGVQYGIYGYDGTQFTDYYAQDGTASGSPVTVQETFTATMGDEVIIMVDGYAGDLCEVDVSVNPVNCSGCALPVELINFKGENKNDVNHLKWITATEINSDYFELQKRNDNNENWQTIEKIKAQGTTTEGTKYIHRDRSYKRGTNYYRLKQYDFNGECETFEPIVIENEKSSMKSVKVINYMGQEVDEDYDGVKIYVYPDGSTEKKVEFEEK